MAAANRFAKLAAPLALCIAVCAAIVAVIALRQGPAPTMTADRLDVIDLRLAALQARVEEMEARLDAIEREASLRSMGAPAPGAAPSASPPRSDLGDYGALMRLVNRRNANEALRPVSTDRLLAVFGQPSEELADGDCAAPTSPRLVSALETRDVGPFSAQLIRPALDSVEEILGRVRIDHPELFAQLVSYGGLCARLIRGSADMVSRHAFGVAIDISIGDTIDEMGDGKTQRGLILLADYFNEAGWVWGAAFGREDSMHFEVSEELFDRWYP